MTASKSDPTLDKIIGVIDAMPDHADWTLDVNKVTNEPMRMRHRIPALGVASFAADINAVLWAGRHGRRAMTALRRARKMWQKLTAESAAVAAGEAEDQEAKAMIRIRRPIPGRYTVVTSGKSFDVTLTRGSGLKAVVTGSMPPPGTYALDADRALVLVEAGAVEIEGSVNAIGTAARLIWPPRKQHEEVRTA